MTSNPLHAIVVGGSILSVEEAFEVEGRSIMIETQHVDDGDSFTVQTLKHGLYRVVHPTVVDVTNTCRTRQFVSNQAGYFHKECSHVLHLYE